MEKGKLETSAFLFRSNNKGNRSKDKNKKRGTILVENIIFIILNLAFITILVLFVMRHGGEGSLLEQAYAKQIALLIDSSNSNTEIFLDIGDGAKVDSQWFLGNFAKSITINGNIITVKFRDSGGYSYSFFNNVAPKIDISPEGKVYMVIK